jgi:hypothetical protein
MWEVDSNITEQLHGQYLRTSCRRKRSQLFKTDNEVTSLSNTSNKFLTLTSINIITFLLLYYYAVCVTYCCFNTTLVSGV